MNGPPDEPTTARGFLTWLDALGGGDDEHQVPPRRDYGPISGPSARDLLAGDDR